MNTKHSFSVFALSLLLLGQAMAQRDSDRWAVARSVTEEVLKPIVEGRTILPKWIGPQVPYFYYQVREAEETSYYIVDARNNRKEALIKDKHRFVEQYQHLTNDTTLNAKNLKLYGIWFEGNDPNTFLWKKKDLYLSYDRITGILKKVDTPRAKSTGQTTAEEKKPKHSYTMELKEHNLYLHKDGSVEAITDDGVAGASYSKGFWVNQYYLCLVQDDREIPEMSMINSLSKPRPQTKTFKMPMPVDKGGRRYKLLYYDADRDVKKNISFGDEFGEVISLVRPQGQSDKVYLSRRSKYAERIELYRVDLKQGELKLVAREEVKPHINIQLHTFRLVDNGSKFLWWSERSGYGRYYLYDSDGRLLREVTQGDALVAGSIVKIDSVRKQFVFSAYGAPRSNPYYRQYYRVGFDGKGQKLLTDPEYDHELILSPDGSYAVDEYSRMDSPKAWRVLSLRNPKIVAPFEALPKQELEAHGWRPPKLIKLKAADAQTDLYGLMYLPHDIDTTKKYPIITHVYPGPQSDQIPQDFTLDNEGNQSLAELGFVVIQVAPRGSSPLRGREFANYSYDNLRDYPLEDIKHSVELLAQSYPFIDLSRVGIYGHSGGGFATVASLLKYPDFYKVGIAASGNHDNNIYIDWWANIYHGKGKIPTNIELASKLKARLMLITGDMDKNVPMSSTLRMADALIKSGKRFDLFVFPGKGHGLESPYYYNLIKNYFLEHLRGEQQEDINIIKS